MSEMLAQGMHERNYMHALCAACMSGNSVRLIGSTERSEDRKARPVMLYHYVSIEENSFGAVSVFISCRLRQPMFHGQHDKFSVPSCDPAGLAVLRQWTVRPAESRKVNRQRASQQHGQIQT